MKTCKTKYSYKKLKMVGVTMLSFFVLSISVSGCDKKKKDSKAEGAEESKAGIKVSYEGVKDKLMELESGHLYKSTKTFSWPDGSGGFEQAKAASATLYLANFNLDPRKGMISLGADLEGDDHIRVTVHFVGAEGTSGGRGDPPMATGEYTGDAERFNKIESATITVVKDGKSVDHDFSRGKISGTFKITSSTEDAIEGEIDIKDETHAIKGKFRAMPFD